MSSKFQPVRKRAQIMSANHVMFIWVAGVSVVLGFAIVGTIFLTQMLIFNEKVISKKNQTITRLEQNNKNVTKLEDQIRALDANEVLGSKKAKAEDRAVQVVLDALPSEANSLALGASLQNVLFAGISGLSIESLKVDPVVGVELLDASSVATEISDNSDNRINFKAVITGTEAGIKTALTNLERSIRTIDIDNLKIESGSGNNLTVTINGCAFYEPERVVQLKEEVVK